MTHETQMTNLLPGSIRLDSTHGAHPTSSNFFKFLKSKSGLLLTSQDYSYMSVFTVVSLLSVLITEEKQSQQTENENS